jgi:SAM-dependent methyltransferase
MFTALLHRSTIPSGWQKIPWHDPDFSRRMLAEHLSQSHDLASRRQMIIEQHVQWIHRKILREQPSKILDLGCGPGLYAKRLTVLGHDCTGLDFSPASVAYAREQHPSGNYILGDVRELDYGEGYDLAMMIYGEMNAFSEADAALIVCKAHAALKPGGKLLLEVHPFETIRQIGQEPSSWYTTDRGLFADEPYLCLSESRYDADTAIKWFYVYTESGAMQQYINMLHAYTDDEYRWLLRGFEQVLFYPSLTGNPDRDDLFVLVAEKAL